MERLTQFHVFVSRDVRSGRLPVGIFTESHSDDITQVRMLVGILSCVKGTLSIFHAGFV